MALPDWAPVFLTQLECTPNVAAAARLAGITKQRVYQVRAENPEFAAAWEDALDTGVQELEGVVWQRAKDQSDTLAIFLLKSHKPARYADPQAQQQHGRLRVEVEFVDNDTDAPDQATPAAPHAG